MPDYDIITIGGGLAGSALATVMARNGYKVLVVERETKFKDRVRGEGMTAWGTAEVKELGLFDVFVGAGARQPEYWQNFVGPGALEPRRVSDSPPNEDGLNFYHPDVQEALIAAAQQAGAEVRRGARVTGVDPGAEPVVHIDSGNGTEGAAARLAVGADGRNSVVRKWGGFVATDDPPGNLVAGLFIENCKSPEDRVILVLNPFMSQNAIYFPVGGGRGRAYVITRASSGERFQGEKDVPRFLEAMVKTGMSPDHFGAASAAGPLATFDGAESFVEHPYREGVALIGDAAAMSDPSWGQGLSLAVRDVRTLRDALLANDDWDAAGHAYAAAHDDHYGKIRTAEQIFSAVFLEMGEEADARRARVLPKLATDADAQRYLPDTMICGPDHAPPTEAHRREVFGEG